MKKILIGVGAIAGVLLIIVVVGAVMLWSNLDGVVRVGTERALSYVLKVDVTVDGADVDARAGTIALKGINIPNPEGYKTPHAMNFGEVFVEADIASFRTNEPTIRLIRVSEPDIIYDRKVNTSNIDDLLANASSAEEEEAAPEEARKQLVIEKVLVEGSTIQVGLPFTEGRTMKANVPNIEINDIGKKNDRVSPAEAMKEVLDEMLAAFAKVGADRLKGGEDAVEKAADEAAGAINEAADEVKEKLGGLLGGKKSE